METKIIERLQHIDDKIDIDESNLTHIQEFYKNAKIFLTGGSGFLGQILIEKLLRSCPVSTIYVLIRQKKGKNMETRLDEILDDQLFNRMKKVCPNFRQKVVAIEGDCAMPDLGLNDQDKKLLMDEVNIVFHVAATVRFDEKLKRAVAINVKAIRDLSFIAQQMPHLKSFVHVSTLFSNCIQGTIKEKVYPAAMNYQQLIGITEALDSLNLENITPRFVGKYPNTYVYTKQIAESVVEQETKGLPAGIYRPAIVLSTYKEPIRGWINNIYGATGVVYGAGLGLIRVMYAAADCPAVCVPVDMCVNGLIASAWDTAWIFQKAIDENEKFEIPVYNCETATTNVITWKIYRDKIVEYGLNLPFSTAIWFPYLLLVKSYVKYMVLTFLLHIIPGSIIDAIMVCTGKKMRFLSAYKKIHAFIESIGYFSIRSYEIHSTGIHRMLKHMSKKDKDVFFCDFRELDWDEYLMMYSSGVRLFLVKDPLDTVPQAKKLCRRFQWANRAVVTIVALLVIALLYWVLSIIYTFIFM